MHAAGTDAEFEAVMMNTVAIVGANWAGGCAARALRDEGFDGRIQLIGAEAYPPYERPPLSKDVLLRHWDPEQTYMQAEDDWARQDITLRLNSTVVRIDSSSREVELADGQRIRADRVLLCTGGRVRRLQIPGEHLDGVEYLRTIDDALAVRSRLQPGRSVVIIGGGFVGTEMAASASQAGCEVTLLEAGNVPLQRVLGPQMGKILTAFHVQRGVRVVTETSAVRIEGKHSVTHVVTDSGERIDADLVVIGVGIVPAEELAVGARIEVSNGIIVNEFCETSVPEVLAAGDVANHPNAILGERVRLEHWQNAQNQAAAAAATITGRRVPFCEVPWFWSDQYDMNVQMAGRPRVSDEIVYRGDITANYFSAFYIRDRVLRGVISINCPRDVRATMKLIETGIEIDPKALSDESTDLRKLSAAG